ncbi:hypothetical protein H4R19_001739, partial [Coemansia spiralis]
QRRARFMSELLNAILAWLTALLEEYPALVYMRCPLGPTGDTLCPGIRCIRDESWVGRYYIPEVVTPGLIMVNVRWNGVATVKIEGRATKHADHLLVLAMVVDGVKKLEALVIEFKAPYETAPPQLIGTDDPQQDSETDSEFAMRRAGLYTADYGNRTVRGQLHRYIVEQAGRDWQPPEDLACNINRCYGILTDEKRMWLVRRRGACPAPTPKQPGQASNPEEWGISPCIYMDGRIGQPHPSAAVAFLVEALIKDMRADPARHATAQESMSRIYQQAISYPQQPPINRSVGPWAVMEPSMQHGQRDSAVLHRSVRRRTSRLSLQQRNNNNGGGDNGGGENGGGDNNGDNNNGDNNDGGENDGGDNDSGDMDVDGNDPGDGGEHAHRRAIASTASASTLVETMRGCPLGQDHSTLPKAVRGLHPEWLRCGWAPLAASCSIGEQLGSGRSGVVCRGTFNGQPAALKCCPADSMVRHTVLPDLRAHELTGEVAAYARLQPLQGSAIPRLFGHGLIMVHGMPYAVLALELVKDQIRRVGDERRRNAIHRQCSLPVREAVVKALQAVHRLGACHRDARGHNVLFEDDPERPGELRGRLIDFSLGMVDPTDTDKAHDLARWLEVLSLNDTPV